MMSASRSENVPEKLRDSPGKGVSCPAFRDREHPRRCHKDLRGQWLQSPGEALAHRAISARKRDGGPGLSPWCHDGTKLRCQRYFWGVPGQQPESPVLEARVAVRSSWVEIPLPGGWLRCVKSAALQVASLAGFAISDALHGKALRHGVPAPPMPKRRRGRTSRHPGTAHEAHTPPSRHQQRFGNSGFLRKGFRWTITAPRDSPRSPGWIARTARASTLPSRSSDTTSSPARQRFRQSRTLRTGPGEQARQ